MSTKSIIRKIAKEHGVTEKEVEANIKEAIRFSMLSCSLSAQEFWKNSPFEGKEPSVDEFLKFCVKRVKHQTLL